MKVPFLMILKRQWYIQLIKKTVKLKNLTINQLAFFPISQKLRKDCYTAKCLCASMNFFLNTGAAFERAVHNIEKMKVARDKNKLCPTVLTNLLKAFDCIKHDLFIV